MMEDLLPNVPKTSDDPNEFKGRKLISLLLVLFFVFSLIGFGIGAFIELKLNKDIEISTEDTEIKEVFYEGKVVYTNPALYPNDNISHALVNSANEKIILLVSPDSQDIKMQVAEGLWVKAYGQELRTSDSKEALLVVDRLEINQTPSQ